MKTEEGRGRGRAEGDLRVTRRATGGAARQEVSHGERPGESRLALAKGVVSPRGRRIPGFMFLFIFVFLLVCIFYMYLYHRAVPTCMA